MSLRTGTYYNLIMLLAFFVIIYIRSEMVKRSGQLPGIRSLAAMDALDDAVGRAAETGRPVHLCTGTRGEISYGQTERNLTGLSIFSYVAAEAAKKGARVITTAANEDYYPMILELAQQAALSVGKPEAYNPDDHYYLGDMAYVANAAGLLEKERVAANIMVGYVTYEGAILAEVSAKFGAFQVGGIPSGVSGTLGLWEAMCDYTLIGEEAYIAGAYLSKNLSQFGAISGADYSKWLLLVLMVIGVVESTAGIAITWQ